MKVDRTLSINRIRGWTDPPHQLRSGLIEAHEAALATPISELTPAQVALLVRQKTELDLVVPIAIELLVQQPLLDAGNYRGDLLAAVLGLPRDYWLSHQDDWFEAHAILSEIDAAFSQIAELRPLFEAAAPRRHGEGIH